MKLAWQQIPSPVVSELLCNTGLDGVVIDTEHGFFNNETLFSCIQVIKLSNFSTVETTQQAAAIHEICKYPKFGGRRGLGLVRENKWGKEELISKPPIIIAQIETITGINNLHQICSYNFDFYMIGPYDLSASLGIPANFDTEEYLSSIEKVRSIIPIEKMAVHIPTDVKNQIKKYNNYGIIAVGMDTTGLLEFYKELI
jgi:2-dehydro-3-deoxyglucarate aldolase